MQILKKEKCCRRCLFLFGVMAMCGIGLLSGCAVPQPTDESGTTKVETGAVTGEIADSPCLSSNPTIYAENPAEENMAGLLQEAAAGAVVRIQVGDVTGSGVLWDVIGEKLVIATTAHIFTEGNGIVEITFADGGTTLIAGYDVTDTDLAFLYVDIWEFSSDQLEQYYLVRREAERAGRLQKGDGVILMGSVDETAGSAYEGIVMEPWIYVEDFAQYMIWVDAEADLGMSGGGLFDYEGYFQGILCGTNEAGETVVLPLSVMEAIYQVS